MKQEGHPLILLIFKKIKYSLVQNNQDTKKEMKKISKITQMLLHKHSQAFLSSFSRIEADLSIIKNDIISGQPDDPAGSDKSH